MDSMGYFFWLAEQATSGLVYGWPLTVGLLVALAIGIATALKSGHRPWSGLLLWTALLCAFPLLILAAGTIWAGAEQHHSTSHWRSYSVFGLLLGGAVVAVVAVVRSRGSRLATSALAALVLWYSWWCSFVAGMSIVDDWL